MSKELQIRDGNLIAIFDLENEDGDIDFCKLLKVSHGVAEEIGMFVDYIATNKIIGDQSKEIADLEAKLAESEKQVEDVREAGNMAVDSWCKNRRKYEAQIAEMQNKSFILYSMLYETLEKQGCENVASQIDQMTGWTYDKEADWLKGNRNYDQLKHQLKVAERTTKLACDELRVLNYRTFDNADIDFEQQFKEQAEKELEGEKDG